MMQSRSRRLLLALLAAATVAAGSGLGAADADFNVRQVLTRPANADQPFFAQRELTLSEHLD